MLSVCHVSTFLIYQTRKIQVKRNKIALLTNLQNANHHTRTVNNFKHAFYRVQGSLVQVQQAKL